MRSLRQLLLLSVLVVPGVASAIPTYTLEISNIDDNFFVFLTNSAVTDQLFVGTGIGGATVGCCASSTATTLDITPDLELGLNTLDFRLDNIQGGGWNYTWNLKQDGVSIASASCGTFVTAPCGFNAGTGVYTDSVSFTVSDTTPVPAPASLGLLVVTLTGIAFGRRRRMAMREPRRFGRP